MIKQTIDDDIKTAMLAGDKKLVTTLRTIKSVILNEEVKLGIRDKGLEQETVLVLLQKEQKKRNEAANMYIQAGEKDRAANEKNEATVIQKYLPKMLSEAEVLVIINEVMAMINNPDAKAMGQIIGQVKQKAGSRVDGAKLAQLVKQKLEEKTQE